MKTLSYWLFSLRIFFSLVTEGLTVFLRLSIGTKSFLTTVVGLLAILVISGSDFTPQAAVQPEVELLKDRQSAETWIVFWESLAATTPNRESFLNLEKLYRYLGEEEQALIYRKRAFDLDPNNPEFASDSWLWEETESGVDSTD